MGNITLSIPEDVHAKMKDYPEVRWSEVARKAIVEKITLLERADYLVRDSKLTQKDVDEIDRKIKKAANKRYR